MDLWRKISQLRLEDSRDFGSKAARLGYLHSLNLSVPEGLAISISSCSPSFTPPKEMMAEIRRLFQESEFLVVRSSFREEDKQEGSFAGVFASQIHLPDEQAVISAIQQVIDSRLNLSDVIPLPVQGPLGGVIIQRMIQPCISGVAVSENAAGKMEIHYVNGHLANLMAGGENGYQVELDPGALPAGGFLQEVAGSTAEMANHFQAAVEMEWAISAERFFILQVRPLPGLAVMRLRQQSLDVEFNRLAHSLHPNDVWSSHVLGDAIPAASRFLISIFEQSTRVGGANEVAFRRLGFPYQRVDLSQKIYERFFNRPYLNVAAYLNSVCGGRNLRLGIDRNGRIQFKWRSLWNRSLWKTLLSLWQTRHLRRQLTADLLKRDYTPDPDSKDCSQLDMAELAEQLANTVTSSGVETSVTHLCFDILTALQRSKLQVFCLMLPLKRQRQQFWQLCNGQRSSHVSQIYQAAQQVCAGQMLLPEFLRRFGHRGSPDWDPAAPRLSEQIKAPSDLQRLFPKAAHRSAPRVNISLWVRLVARLAARPIQLFQELVIGRENSQLVCFDWVARCRRLLLAIGEKTKLGDEIFELSYDDIQRHAAGGDWPAGVATATSRHLLSSVYLPPVLSLSNMQNINHPPQDKHKDVFQGQGLVPGYCRGPLRWVSSREEAVKVAPGEIVAARHIDPSWFYLFSRAGALFLENASSYCHPVVLARELGIPTVSGRKAASLAHYSGQTVELDANRGQLRCCLPTEK